VQLGHRVVDECLEFLAARRRSNTVLAAGFDLKVFFTLLPKDPDAVTTADVLAFITAQRETGDPKVIRLADGESGLSARTIQRRLSSLSSMFSYLLVRGDVARNPVPQGLSTRRSRRRGGRGVPLIRTPRTLPRIVDPTEVDALLGACRRLRDRAMFEAMVLGGLRRCEVLGLRLTDLDAAHRQVLIADGKGGYQRQIPISARWFVTVGDYLRIERPKEAEAVTDRVFVVLKANGAAGRYRTRASNRSLCRQKGGPGYDRSPVTSYAIPVSPRCGSRDGTRSVAGVGCSPIDRNHPPLRALSERVAGRRV
jgi:site-specific recombinase XerD